MIWVPAVVTIPLDLSWFWLPVYSRPGAVSIPVWMIMLGTMLGFGYCIGALILLGRNYFQDADTNERRRIRVLAGGFAVTIFAVAFSVLQVIPWKPLHRGLEAFRRNWPAGFIVTLFYGVAPLCTAYAILRHRMFEIRVMVRLGLRYAAARGLLLSVVPLIGLLLGLDLLTHGNQTLLEILGRRGWIYSILGLSAFLLHARRKIWLDALDRRFFRERYDAQKILRDVVEDIRQAASLEEASPKVISQIERALHPEFAVLLLREADSKEYRAIAPNAGVFPSIHAESKLIALAKLLDKPIEISQEETGWLRRQLPEKEVNFLEQSRLEWIFPVFMGGRDTEALLALGAKKSEEPYSREDKDLIEAITGSLALLLEKGAITGRLSLEAGFKECTKCGICYEAATESCPEDGAPLTFVPSPRLFARRYRLDRRLGQGGMGTVYRAFDTELDRNVAIKMIRQEFLASAEIAARFKREAKAAAGFAHPNVVTIYDFGVTEDSRAYIIMEFLEGVTLRQELAAQKRLPPETAVKILREVCGAVEAAHERRLLHRDLKPENIFLARSQGREAAKILDFGIAKLMVSREDTLTAHSATEPGLLIGTFRYMSPEQLRGEAPSESWDLWALAVVAFEILTGVHPFGSSPDWQNAVLTGRFVPILKHIPQAPEAWQEFFERALAIKLSKRPASARELCDEFQKAIA